MTESSNHDCQECSCKIEYDERELILSKLHDAIDYLHDKSMKGRIHDANTEKVRIQWFKALAYACSIYNQIKRDAELDELKEEIETIKNSLIGDNNE